MSGTPRPHEIFKKHFCTMLEGFSLGSGDHYPKRLYYFVYLCELAIILQWCACVLLLTNAAIRTIKNNENNDMRIYLWNIFLFQYIYIYIYTYAYITYIYIYIHTYFFVCSLFFTEIWGRPQFFAPPRRVLWSKPCCFLLQRLWRPVLGCLGNSGETLFFLGEILVL